MSLDSFVGKGSCHRQSRNMSMHSFARQSSYPRCYLLSVLDNASCALGGSICLSRKGDKLVAPEAHL
jgi:hypothetical protein